METSAASQEEIKKPAIFLNELAIGTGYVHGVFKHSYDYSVYPAFVRLGFNINTLVGLEGCQSTFQLALEPFLNSIQGENQGVEAGSSIGVRYLHKLSTSVDVFTEASVAPMFLGIDTVEQGKSGFNFLDQIGAGLQYKFSGKGALFVGYRFRHISNATLVNRPNAGLNSDALVSGFTWLY